MNTENMYRNRTLDQIGEGDVGKEIKGIRMGGEHP